MSEKKKCSICGDPVEDPDSDVCDACLGMGDDPDYYNEDNFIPSDY